MEIVHSVSHYDIIDSEKKITAVSQAAGSLDNQEGKSHNE